MVAGDWETLRAFTQKANEDGFPVYGVRVAGRRSDGDHNVFFLDNDGQQRHPMRYKELADGFKGAT